MKRFLAVLFLLTAAALPAQQMAGLFMVPSAARGGPAQPPEEPPEENPEELPLRINAAGPLHSDPALDVWEASRLFTGGSISTYTGTVAGAPAVQYGSALFLTELYGAFTFAANVSTSPKLVTLYFSENYRTTPGTRLFDVRDEDEDTLLLDDFDVFAEANGQRIAIARSFLITPADGSINLAWEDAGPADPIVNAIKIEEYVATPPAAIADLATVAGDTQVTFTFTPAENSTQTNLYWDTTSTVTTGDTKVADIQSGHALTGLANGVQIWAKVAAENDDGESALSNLVTATPAAAVAGVTLFANVAGSDANDGSNNTTQALRSAIGMRDRMRVLTGRTVDGTTALPLGWTGARLEFDAGTFPQVATMFLDERDSGSSPHPIVYAGAAGEEIIWTGAHQVDDEDWSLVTSANAYAWGRLPTATRAQTYQLNVTAQGINTGTLSGGFSSVENTLMLIVDGEMKHMSRWPNAADSSGSGWVVLDSWTDTGPGGAATMTFSETTPQAWNEANQDILVYGAPGVPFSLAWERTSAIDTVSGATRLTIPARSGSYAINYTAGVSHFVALRNALNAVTAGTYAWNRFNGMLYYLPADGEGAPTNTSLTLLDGLVQCGTDETPANAAQYVTFENITFEGTRSKAVVGYHAAGVRLEDCTFRNMGGNAFYFEDALTSGADGCTFLNLGRGPGYLQGQGHSTLTDSGCFFTGNAGDELGWYDVSIPGALWLNDQNGNAGCGVAVTGNTFTDVRGAVIMNGSSRVLIDDNVFQRTATMVGDLGTVYMGAKFTCRYVTISGCSFLDQTEMQHVDHSVFAIYIDDAFRGAVIEDNIFNACSDGIQLGGGQETIVRRNKFTDCHLGQQQAPIRIASRIPRTDLHAPISADLNAVPLNAEPWATDFPELGGNIEQTGVTANAGNDTWTKTNHRLVNGQRVEFDAGTGFGGFSAGTFYWVRDRADNTFKLSATEGGAVKDVTSNGTAGVIRGELYAWRLYPSNGSGQNTTTIVDNMATNGTYLITISPVTGGNSLLPFHDFTQLNYTPGSSGTPVEGGGTAALSTMDRQF